MQRLALLLTATLLAIGCGDNSGDLHPSSSSSASGATPGSSASGSPGSSGASGKASTSKASGSSGSSPTGASATGSTDGASAGASGGASTGRSAAAGSNTGTTGSTGSNAGCLPFGTYVGVGDDSMCCSGVTTPDGYCGTPSSTVSAAASSTGGLAGAGNTSGSGSLSGNASGASGSTGATSGTTGMVVGSPCPHNMPNIHTGQNTKGGACSGEVASEQCPAGFSCVNGECLLHGVDSPLQITLSWDDPEDLDLHVLEPGHPDAGYGPNKDYCEIYYANPGPVPQDAGINLCAGDGGGLFGNLFCDGGLFNRLGEGQSCSVGWLDRDSNAACRLDNIDIENVLYPQSPPYQAAPGGTYIVRVDYWEDCNGAANSAYAVQIRNDGYYSTFCGSLSEADANGGGAGSGRTVDMFTVP